MTLAYIFTNYNNSNFTYSVIKSISSQISETVNPLVVIIDNCSNEEDKSSLTQIANEFSFIKLIFNNENVGYFKGLNVGLKYIKENYPEINFFIIGNNDLEFPQTFTDQLLKSLDLFKHYPVVSPDIITYDGEHQNPHVLKKISKLRGLIFDLYYTNYILSKLILMLSKISKKLTDRNDEKNFNIASEIYQGHGSCYILGPLFVKDFEELFAPTFLMSEEFFLAFQLKLKGYSLYYTPSIKVTHFGHASLKNVPSKFIWKISRESHKIYKKYLNLYNKI